MYAVIETGGKQYRVAPGETVYLEKLAGTAGDSVEFDRVLLVSDGTNAKIGTPTVSGAKVTGQVVEQGRGKKLIVYKFMRRKDYRRKNGHRQPFTAVQVKDVIAP